MVVIKHDDDTTYLVNMRQSSVAESIMRRCDNADWLLCIALCKSFCDGWYNGTKNNWNEWYNNGTLQLNYGNVGHECSCHMLICVQQWKRQWDVEIEIESDQ